LKTSLPLSQLPFHSAGSYRAFGKAQGELTWVLSGARAGGRGCRRMKNESEFV